MTGKKSTERGVSSTVKTDRRVVPRVNIDGPDPFPEKPPTAEELRDLVGTETTDAAISIVASGLEALGGESLVYRPLLLAIFAEEEPRTALEAMLLVQSVSLYLQTMKLGSYANASASPKSRAALSKSMNNSARTFADLILALKKYRSNASQTVRIERVNVSEGGQAIIGNVGAKKGGCDEI